MARDLSPECKERAPLAWKPYDVEHGLDVFRRYKNFLIGENLQRHNLA